MVGGEFLLVLEDLSHQHGAGKGQGDGQGKVSHNEKREKGEKQEVEAAYSGRVRIYV
ncbi:hypothetical protein Thermus77412_23740 [Thermus antranikianii]